MAAAGTPIIVNQARKRGHKDDDILHAFRQAMRVIDLDDQDGFTMVVGPDQAGNILEVGFIDGEDGPVIVHCMNCRQSYLPWP